MDGGVCCSLRCHSTYSFDLSGKKGADIPTSGVSLQVISIEELTGHCSAVYHSLNTTFS